MLVKTKSLGRKTEAKKHEQFRMLLVTELAEISEGLDRVNAMRVRLSDGSAAEVVITHLQPMVVEEAIRDGFFGPGRVERALRLARNMHTYNAKISYLLSVLSWQIKEEQDSGQFVLHAIQEIEPTRQAIVTDSRKLANVE
jgi:hypothetical protein